MDTNRPTVKGRAVEVDILEEGAGFVLSVGPVSLWLGPNAAIDVLDTLARAISVEREREREREREPPHDAPTPRSSVRRNIFS